MRGKILVIIILLLVLAAAGCTKTEKETQGIQTGGNFETNNETLRIEIPQERPDQEIVEKIVFPDDTVIITINNTSAINTTSLERKIHNLVNVERVKLGLSIMSWDEHLSYIARGHSRDMATRNYFEHEDPEGRNFAYRYNKSGYACNIVIGIVGNAEETALGGENLYLTHTEQRDWYEEKGGEKIYIRSDYYTEKEIAETTVQGWMNSTTHRENIERSYWKKEGIGVVVAEDNTIYVTENFC